MAMGSTDRVQLNDEMQKAKAACATYRAALKAAFAQIDAEISNLIPSGFDGEAANGYMNFYNSVIKPFLEAGGTVESYLGVYDDDASGIFSFIEKAFITPGSGLDPELGNQNNSQAGN